MMMLRPGQFEGADMRRSAALCLLLFVASGIMSIEVDGEDGAAADRIAGYDRPYGDPKQSRSVVIATHGIVATSHPLAAQAALNVLQSGGNVVVYSVSRPSN